MLGPWRRRDRARRDRPLHLRQRHHPRRAGARARALRVHRRDSAADLDRRCRGLRLHQRRRRPAPGAGARVWRFTRRIYERAAGSGSVGQPGGRVVVTVGADGLVSPEAASRAIVEPAPQRPDLNDSSVALVDTMVNTKAGWGRGILRAVDEELRRTWPHVSTTLIRRPQLGVHEPLRWARAMAAQHAAVVIAAGD